MAVLRLTGRAVPSFSDVPGLAPRQPRSCRLHV